MQIAQVQVNDTIYPLVEGEPLQIKAGDVIKVYVSFRGKVAERTTVQIWASLYHYVLGVLNRQEKAQTKGTMTLEATTVLTEYQPTVDIAIGDVSAGTYGLIVELPDYNLQAKIDDCLEVAAEAGIFDMIGPLLVLGLMMGLMSMVSPMMKEGVE